MLIIGIAGGTGSGKTTIVNKLIKQLPNDAVVVIPQDAYYKNTSHLNYDDRVKINFDHPNAIDFNLLVNHIKKLKNNEPIVQPEYSFVSHNRTKNTFLINPKKVIIIEGILVLSNSDIRDLCDIKIFVDADNDERLIRRLKRDIIERGRDINEVLNRYQTTLKPMHEQFIAPVKNYADIIIPNNADNTNAVEIIRTIIEYKL